MLLSVCRSSYVRAQQMLTADHIRRRDAGHRTPRPWLPVQSQLPGQVLHGRRMSVAGASPAEADDSLHHLRLRIGHQTRRTLQGLRPDLVVIGSVREYLTLLISARNFYMI